MMGDDEVGLTSRTQPAKNKQLDARVDGSNRKAFYIRPTDHQKLAWGAHLQEAMRPTGGGQVGGPTPRIVQQGPETWRDMDKIERRRASEPNTDGRLAATSPRPSDIGRQKESTFATRSRQGCGLSLLNDRVGGGKGYSI